MNIYKIISILTVALNIISYAWSVIGVFKKIENINNKKQLILKIVSIITWILVLNSIYKSELTNNSYSIYSLFQIFLLMLFWRTSKIVKRNSFSIVYSNDIPTKLVKEGLYKYIRHPFYTIYLSCYISSAFITKDVMTILSCFSILLIYIDAAKTEERKFEKSNLETTYNEYKSQAGLFWPKL